MKSILQYLMETNLNDNFWKWFGDSKVVDSSGNPLVVYHGSRSHDIHYFAGRPDWKKQYNEEVGTSYFTTDFNMASGYGKKVYSVYLTMINPRIVDVKGESYISANYDNIIKARLNNNDSVILKNVEDTSAGQSSRLIDVYITFSPTQIKSIDNQGTWNPNDPNIYK